MENGSILPLYTTNIIMIMSYITIVIAVAAVRNRYIYEGNKEEIGYFGGFNVLSTAQGLSLEEEEEEEKKKEKKKKKKKKKKTKKTTKKKKTTTNEEEEEEETTKKKKTKKKTKRRRKKTKTDEGRRKGSKMNKVLTVATHTLRATSN